MLLHGSSGIRYERWNVQGEWWHELCEVTGVKVDWSHLDVMRCVVVFRVVVGKVCFSWGPFDGQLALVYSVRDPMESHVHCLGAFQLVVTVGKATGSGIVSGDFGGARLFMAKLLQNLSDEDSFLAIVEEGSYLGFSG